MSNVVLTTQGLQYVLSAHNNGIYVDIRYFVPIYDNRIDPTIRLTNYTLSSFSQVADRGQTSPYGEVIWNTTGYTLSNESKYAISASSFTGGDMNGSYQRATVQTNLLNGVPLSPQISGTEFAI